MLMDRIIGAFTFRKGVYAEVENDQSFTSTAWMLVAVVSVLRGLGSLGLAEDLMSGLLGALGGAVFAVLGFAFGAWVLAWVGKAMFNADTSFDEMVRVLGLAYVWNVIGVLGIFGGVISCLLAPLTFAAAIAGLVAWWFAAHEALDLEWVQAIIAVVVAWLVSTLIVFIGSMILGALGLGAGVAAGLFGS